MLRSSNGKPLTSEDIREWQRERDAKKDDFPFIALSKQQEKLLRKCALDYVEKTGKNRFDANHLRDLDFIYINKTDRKGAENIEFCEIRARGRNYLAYIDGERKKVRQQFFHNWKVAVFSAFAGALLARPIWDGIDWLIAFMQSLIEKR